LVRKPARRVTRALAGSKRGDSAVPGIPLTIQRTRLTSNHREAAAPAPHYPIGRRA
jgi:hypothetical protein